MNPRLPLRFAAPALALAIAGSLAAAAAATAATPSTTLLSCQQTIDKESRAFVGAREKRLGTCLQRKLACEVDAEKAALTGAALTACRDRAARTCDRMATLVARAGARRSANTLSACGGVPVADLNGTVSAVTSSLGFRAGCAATSASRLDACLGEKLACAADRRAAAALPRAAATLAAGSPTTLTAGCLPVTTVSATAAGSGASGRELSSFQKRASAILGKLAGSRATAIADCQRGLLGCALANEIENVASGACFARETTRCARKLDRAAGQAARAPAALQSAAGGIALADLRIALGFASLDDACADLGESQSSVAALASCAAQRLVHASDASTAVHTPRACLLLQANVPATDRVEICPSVGTTIRAAASTGTPNTPDGVQPTTSTAVATIFGTTTPDLNQVIYTRHRRLDASGVPDAVLVLVPGFEGGASGFLPLAENLIRLARLQGQELEVWAIDRRSNLLEDLAGVDVAEALLDPYVAMDWLFGGELGLPLSPDLAAGPNRRAVFLDTTADASFIAEWTPLLFSRDIDDVVAEARAVARNQNVFLGGHSAGTGFAARYAATDFDPGIGVDPGYTHVKGLVLLEGGGGSTGQALSSDTLDRIVAKADGGLQGAVAAGAPRCVDGTTPCTLASEAADCAGQLPPVCTEPTSAYSVVPGLLNPRVLATSEVAGIQGINDPDGGQVLLQVGQGSPGNYAFAVVPDLAILNSALIPKGTVEASIGAFVDDDGLIAASAFFVASSVGAPGPTVGGLATWLDANEPQPASATPNNNSGVVPSALPAPVWGQEREVVQFRQLLRAFYEGGTNFADWYYPSSGLGVTSVAGRCVAGTCKTGANAGSACTTDSQCAGQSISLDSTALSVGRSRPDIENLTQAATIDIPVIGFGGSNGLVRAPGSFTPFGTSIATCTAPSCDGSTPRVVNASSPNPAFPTLGGVNGGFEVYMSEGYAHVDVLMAEDVASNNVLRPLRDFLLRNAP